MSGRRIHDLIQELLGPALEVSLDPVAISDEQSRIVYANSAMRTFLGLRAKDIQASVKFAELLTLPTLQGGCPVSAVISSGETVRYDEEPAIKRDGEKLRIILKCVPLKEISKKDGGLVFGAILSIRDTTAETLLQAKYHKIGALLEEKNVEIGEVRSQLNTILSSLRNQRRG